jgi:hypothetical protein
MAQNNFTATGIQSWATPSNWSLGHAPTSSEDAFIGTTGTIVGSGSNETVLSIGTGTNGDALDINSSSTFETTQGTGPNGNFGTIVVEDGSTLQDDSGTFSNSGTLKLNSTGSVTSFVIEGFVQLMGGGSVELALNSGAQNYILGGKPTATLINDDNDISGTGAIGGLFFTNNGIIETNNSLGAGDMHIWGNSAGGSFENDGSMFADDGGILELGVNSATVSMGNTGLIEAVGATKATKIQIDGNVTINAVGGRILLAGPNANFDEIVSDGLPATLNLNGGTLDGSGAVGDSQMTLNIEQGTVVNADHSGGLLELSTGANTITNAGLLEATNGGILGIASPLSNSGTIAANSGEVLIGNSVTGLGVVDIGANGLVDMLASASLINNVQFTDGNALLRVRSIGNIEGNIVGAGAADEIDVRFVNFVSGLHTVWQQNGGSGLLSLVNNGSTLVAFNLVGQYTSADFSAANDSAGGTLISINNPPPPAATTADMILRNTNSGAYEIYDIGNNTILSAHFLGQVGTNWAFVTLGGFDGSDTTDMLLRNGSTGGFEVYDISNNNITNAAFLGTVGLNWQVMGFGDFSSNPGETDMMLRNANTGGLEVYDISNNQIINSAFMGTVGLNWQVGGFGDFSSNPGESDMILRNTTTGGLEVYDISNNQITNAAFMGTVGLNWQIVGVGDFSSIPGETDMMMRNTNTGAFEVYDISNNQITSAFSLGTVGLNWQVAGFGPMNGAGTSDMVLRNVNTGAFEVYDIANNQLAGAAPLGSVGLDWQLGGFATDPPTASNSSQAAQLVQAMAGFGGGSGAAESLNTAPLGADTSQQTLLTTPQHG